MMNIKLFAISLSTLVFVSISALSYAYFYRGKPSLVLANNYYQGKSGTIIPNSDNPLVQPVISLPSPDILNPHKEHELIHCFGKTKKKVVALSFDDGPDDKFTPQILDILKQNNIKATFFVIGNRIDKYPQVVRRIIQDGHIIANHTFNHKSFKQLSDEEILTELKMTDNALDSLIGFHTKLIRPPFGIVSQNQSKVINDNGYEVVNWCVDTEDWSGIPTDQLVKNVNSQVCPGAIVLQHSSGGKNNNLSNTIAALPEIIKSLEQNNYQFVTIPEIINLDDYLLKKFE